MARFPSLLLLAVFLPSTMATPSLDVDTHHILSALPTDITTIASAIQPSWASSYSVGDACYCLPNVPVDVSILVDTPFGKQTVGAACSLIGPGPGITISETDNTSNRPLYNDPQCGNGLPLVTDEALCPGRVDHGVVGCRYIGPKWDFTEQLAYNSVPGGILEDNTAVLDITGLEFVTREWGSSYSAGDRCYCLDNWRNWPGSSTTIVSTSIGDMTVAEACQLVGEGPGAMGRPTYNDIQCGNGPFGTTDEEACPGRADFGVQGCRFIGPKWNFGSSSTTSTGVRAPSSAPIRVEFVDSSPTTSSTQVTPAVGAETPASAATTVYPPVDTSSSNRFTFYAAGVCMTVGLFSLL